LIPDLAINFIGETFHKMKKSGFKENRKLLPD